MIPKLRRFLRWTWEYDPYATKDADFVCRCGETFDERKALDEHLAETGDPSTEPVRHAVEG